MYQEAVATLKGLLEEARAAGDSEPTAMTLATVDSDDRPDARIVLLKHVDERGLCFFTNYASTKAGDIAVKADVALCLHWKTLGDGVQVRAQGRATKLEAAESDAYFATRSRPSQLGAWASLQSQILPDRAELQMRFDEVERRYAGQAVPRPPHWGGYVVAPVRMEFWYGARFRLHERVCYRLGEDGWSKGWLYP